jgi:hypothetical protein
MNQNEKSMPKVPTKSESTSFTVVVGVSNWAAQPESGLTSCGSMTYTVGVSGEPADHSAGAPEVFAAGSVRSLKSRLRSGPSASNDYDASGDI